MCVRACVRACSYPVSGLPVPLEPLRDPNVLLPKPAAEKLAIFDFFGHVVQGPVPRLPEAPFSREFREFVAACLAKEATKRPSLEDLLVRLVLVAVSRPYS